MAIHTALGKRKRNLTQLLFTFTNKKLKRFTVNKGITPIVKVIPARSHLSAGNIASGCGIWVLCVRYGIAKYIKHTAPTISRHNRNTHKTLFIFIATPPYIPRVASDRIRKSDKNLEILNVLTPLREFRSFKCSK